MVKSKNITCTDDKYLMPISAHKVVDHATCKWENDQAKEEHK
jgi:hypothetical protein